MINKFSVYVILLLMLKPGIILKGSKWVHLVRGLLFMHEQLEMQ